MPLPAPITGTEASAVAAKFGLVYKCLLPETDLSGSPERSQDRVAISCDTGVFVLERFLPTDAFRKKEIAACLRQLAASGMKRIVPPVADAKKESVVTMGPSVYQITPYIEGIPLPRPAYVEEGWRGTAFASFLTDLAMAPPVAKDTVPFSIFSYIHTLQQAIERHQPRLLPRITPVIDWVTNRLLPLHDAIPVRFCHGDVHPINAIWEEKDIRAVIDWEFCGPKPEIYDLANLLGCVGSEDPNALSGNLTEHLLKGVFSAKIYSETGINALFPYVVALRFAWLSEWLRKSDFPMIEMECDYLHLFITHSEAIESLWRTALP